MVGRSRRRGGFTPPYGGINPPLQEPTHHPVSLCRLTLLICRWAINGRHRDIVEPQVDSKLGAVVNQVIHHHAAQDRNPRHREDRLSRLPMVGSRDVAGCWGIPGSGVLVFRSTLFPSSCWALWGACGSAPRSRPRGEPRTPTAGTLAAIQPPSSILRPVNSRIVFLCRRGRHSSSTSRHSKA